jgi:limonene-1,2-epoxide hydrolase
MNKIRINWCVLLFIGMLILSFSQLACSSQSEKEKKERIAVERYFSEALDGKKFDYIAELFAEDGVQNFPGIPPIRGNKTMVAAMNALLGPSKSFKTKVYAIVVEGNNVMASIEHEMIYGPGAKFRTQAGVQPEFLDMGGKKIVWKAMALFIFNDDGKVTEEYINRDDVRIYLQGGKVTVSQ